MARQFSPNVLRRFCWFHVTLSSYKGHGSSVHFCLFLDNYKSLFLVVVLRLFFSVSFSLLPMKTFLVWTLSWDLGISLLQRVDISKSWRDQVSYCFLRFLLNCRRDQPDGFRNCLRTNKLFRPILLLLLTVQCGLNGFREVGRSVLVSKMVSWPSNLPIPTPLLQQVRHLVIRFFHHLLWDLDWDPRCHKAHRLWCFSRLSQWIRLFNSGECPVRTSMTLEFLEVLTWPLSRVVKKSVPRERSSFGRRLGFKSSAIVFRS